MNSSSKSQTGNSFCDSSRGNLTELSGVWETVDRLKEGLARTERKLALAGKDKWGELEDIPARIETEEAVKPKTFVRKICKIDSQRRRSKDDRPLKKLQKLEEPNWDSDWDAYFHREKFHTACPTNEIEVDAKFTAGRTARHSTDAETSLDKFNRLSAGYDPSQRKNKVYHLRENVNSNASNKRKGGPCGPNLTVRDNAKDYKNEIKDGKNIHAVPGPRPTKKIDNLQKVGQLVEKQQLKKRFLRSSATVSKPSDAIIPLSMASQSKTQQNAIPRRKVALVRPASMSSALTSEHQRSTASWTAKGEKQKGKDENKLFKKYAKTKKLAKISQNVEDYIICPTSWKKGKELFSKEFGTSEMAENERNTLDVDSGEYEREFLDGTDASARNDDEKCSPFHEQTETIAGVKADEHKVDNRARVNKRKPTKPESECERLTKERHYNAEAIRDYISKRRKERIQQILTEKQRKEKEKEDRKNKLEQLQQLQKKLARVSVVRRSESENDDFEEQQRNGNTIKPIESEEPRSEPSTESPRDYDRPVEEGVKRVISETSEFPFSDAIERSVEIGEKITERAIKLSSIHATAMSLQLQIASESNRIARMLESSNDALGEHELLVVRGAEPSTSAEARNDFRVNDDGGRGEPQRSGVDERLRYETRHEKIVQSRSQFSVFEGADLPGVTNLVKHARLIVDSATENSAACKIQAYYRGYRVRRSLKWRFTNRGGEVSNVNGGDVSSERHSVPNFLKTGLGAGFTEAIDESKNELRVKTKLQSSKPDPYNIINTLHRTIGKINCETQRVREVEFLSDLNRKSDDSSHRDFEDGGINEKQNETREIDRNSASPRFAPLPTSLSVPVQTSPENTTVDSMESVRAKRENDRGVIGNQRTKKTDEASEFEFESLSGGSLDSSHDSNNKSNDEFVSPSGLKYSPSSLKLWMSSELVYLESLEDSLLHVSRAERIQGVTAAQQETATLAQALQAEQQRRLEEIGKMRLEREREITEQQKLLTQAQKRHEDALATAVESVALARSQASSAINLNAHKLMQSQAVAAQVTAEAAKQLAQANLATIELNRNLQSKIENKSEMGTATSNAIAAVTSMLNDLHRNSRRKELAGLPSLENNDDKSDDGQNHSQESNTTRSSTTQLSVIKTNSANNEVPTFSEDKSFQEEVISTCGVDSNENVKTNEYSSDEPSAVPTIAEYETTLSEGSIEEEDVQTESSIFENAKSNKSSDNSSAGSIVQTDQPKKNFDGCFPIEQWFSNKDSLKNFTLEMVRQYTKKEELRSKQQMALLKMREKSLVEKTKAEIAWLELQKQQLRNQGEEEKMPPLRKRQRWLTLRLQQEQNEIKRLREAQLMANQERQMLLQQQQQIAHMRQSTKQILGKIREISPGMQLPSLKSLPSSTRSLNASPKTSVIVDTMSSSHTEDEQVADTQSDVGEGTGEVYAAIIRDSKSDSEIPLENANKSNSLASRVLQGLKKFEMNKQKLTARELKLLERGKDVKNLVAWRATFDVEEKVESLDEESDKHNSTLEQLTVSTDEQIKKSAIDSKSNSIQEEIKQSVDYGSSFETTSKSNEKQSAPNLAIRLPLSPRTQHRRKDSSGSEDSFTVSQSETVSDLSDIEGRVYALKEELRRRKVEADRLRKEQKRRNKERLKAQEASLIKQIEAYDKFICQTKSELDHELEVESKSSVKPQIRRPQVAESRHVNKIQMPLVTDPKGEEQQQSSKSATRDDDTIASSLSDLTIEKSISTQDDKLDSESENEESTSDSVKTVTEKTEEKSTNELKTNSCQPEKGDINNACKSHQSTVMQSAVGDEAIFPQEEKLPSDDETMAEEIEDEEIEMTEADDEDNVETEAEMTSAAIDKKDKSENSDDAGNSGDTKAEEKLVESVRTVSTSPTFRDGDDNLDSKRATILVDLLFTREVNEAIRDIMDKMKKRHECSDLLRQRQCDLITDSYFSQLLADNLSVVCRLHSRFRRRLSVGDRVKSILNEIEVKSLERNERFERTSLNDILTLSSPTAYNDVLTSPEGTATTNSESPAREESPLSRSSSSAQQDDFPTCDADGEEWFEDEMQDGGNFYQIYPCKQYYYIREIPNKPPPPYTPPPVSATPTVPAQISLVPSVTSQLVAKNEYAQTYASHTEAEVQTLIARAVTLFHESMLEGNASVVPPDDYYHIAATDDDTTVSHRAFRQFLFDLSGELLHESLLRRRESGRPPWMKPKWISRTRVTATSNESSDMVRFVQSQVIALISAETTHPHHPGGSICIGRKKQDRVDEILVKELREEELNWINYDQDEVTVKVQLADSILNCLLKETTQLVTRFKIR